MTITKYIRICILLAILIMFVAVPPTLQVQAAGKSLLCQNGSLTFPLSYSVFNFTFNVTAPANAGEVITFKTANALNGGAATVSFDGVLQSGPGPYKFVIPSTGIHNFTLWYAGASFGSIDVIGNCTAPSQSLNFTDGRCNQEPWQSLAVYPDGSGGYNFYALYKSVGHFAMHITKAQLDANPGKGVNYLIASELGVSLYRMADGGLMAARGTEDGKVYTFIIGGCGAA
jgi:hypothetical protein